MQPPRSLHELQLWMQGVITHPAGVEAGAAAMNAQRPSELAASAMDAVCPSRTLSRAERLAIYNHAYFARLIECIEAQFPAVKAALGGEAFQQLAFGYLCTCPSTSYTLARLTDSFAQYLMDVRPARVGADDELDFADFVIELAELEQVYSDVFDGPGPERSLTLTPEDLQQLTPGAFVECRLKLHPCVRLLERQFPVHEYASAVRKGGAATIPDPRPTCLIVTRRDYIVRRFEVSRSQFELLQDLSAGDSIGMALMRFRQRAETLADRDLAELTAWFRDWSAAPLFAALQRPGSANQ